MDIPEEAACERAVLHDFTADIDNDEAIKEHCVNCGKTVIFNKYDGKVDDSLYLRTHFRDFLQPVGPSARLFHYVYGQEAVENHAKAVEKLEKKARSQSGHFREELREYTKDVLKTVKSLESQGKL